METDSIKKQDGFIDEEYVIIPVEAFEPYMSHQLVKTLYLMDAGFFPRAKHHFREREEGSEEYILIYCTDGEGTIELENKIFQLNKHEVCCIPPHTKHRYYTNNKNPWSIYWVHFKGSHTIHYPLSENQIITINSPEGENRIITLFDILFRTLKRNYTQGNYIYISQVLGLILAEIYFREKIDGSSEQDKYITAAIRYMHKNLQKSLLLEDISKELSISKSHLSAGFKKFTNKSPIDFFIQMKMQEACRLLKSTSMYIVEISTTLGYEDQYYFSRIFKKTIGVSPKDYRNRASIYKE